MQKSLLICPLIALYISGCTSAIKDINTGLATINNGLSTVNSTLSEKQSTQRGTMQSSSNASITQSQQRKLQESLNQNIQDKNINNAINEAAPVISSYTEVQSCLTRHTSTELNQFAAPGANLQYQGGPVTRMKYHDKSTCATVLRIHGWEMPARNALRFETIYISDSSGETMKYNHELIKQPNGEWLFSR